MREFNGRLEDVAGFLADERGDLAAAVSELSVALGDVADFVRDNRDVLQSNVDRLTEVTDVLVKQRNALAEILDVAPAALGNLSLAYNGSSGTLDTRADINELTLPPIVLVCEALRRGTPQDLPAALSDACSHARTGGQRGRPAAEPRRRDHGAAGGPAAAGARARAPDRAGPARPRRRRR